MNFAHNFEHRAGGQPGATRCWLIRNSPTSENAQPSDRENAVYEAAEVHHTNYF
jgi:hypothetical protein